MRFAVIGLIGCLGLGTHPAFADKACRKTNNETRADANWQRFKFEQRHMGVLFAITLYASDKSTANDASNAAFRQIAELNRIMSDYDPNSELMRLCRNSGPGKPVRVSRDLLIVLQRSIGLSCKTGGAFDITVGPIVKLWRRARRRKELPTDKRLNAAKQLVGYRNIVIDVCAQTVELRKKGMKLDLGGIAKGYAADAALSELRKLGITRALIDASGDIVAGDPPPGKPAWKVAIAPLVDPEANPTIYLALSNAAVATSGDAFQFVEIDGIRYSHIVDPQTGMGLTTHSSVTVIARNATKADSLASAVSVLGPQRGLSLIEGICESAVLIHVIRDGQFKSFRSRRFHQEQFGVKAPQP